MANLLDIRKIEELSVKGSIIGGVWNPIEQRLYNYHEFKSIGALTAWASSMPRYDGCVPTFIDEWGRVYEIKDPIFRIQ